MFLSLFKKKSYLIAFLILLTTVSFLIGYLPTRLYILRENAQQNEPLIKTQTEPVTKNTTVPSVSPSDKVCIYIAKEYNNSIGIFVPQNLDSPVSVINTNIKNLPEYDRRLLEYGIRLYSDTQLQQLIEDYSS